MIAIKRLFNTAQKAQKIIFSAIKENTRRMAWSMAFSIDNLSKNLAVWSIPWKLVHIFLRINLMGWVYNHLYICPNMIDASVDWNTNYIKTVICMKITTWYCCSKTINLISFTNIASKRTVFISNKAMNWWVP